MVSRLLTTVVIGLLMAVSAPAWAAAPEPVLFVLQPADADAKAGIAVRAKPALERVREPQAHPRWLIHPGEPIKAPSPPPAHVVDLYGGGDLAPELLVRVIVRYFAGERGWVPRFQIHEEPAVVRVGDRWVPLTLAQGLPALVVQHGGTLPNADGFYPQIDFSLTTGAFAVTAWRAMR